ncbi:EamA family transporter, partial [Burkholderia cenocepacia]|nr:EamA family transporter [Burkholderia cenocepacia]
LSLSIGYASNGRQAIEVAMVNYLWPSLTLVAAEHPADAEHRQQDAGHDQQIRALLVERDGGDQGLDPAGMLRNVADNPLSYGLAFVGA